MSEHDSIRELLALAVAGALEPKEQERVERHARECAACTAELEGWQLLASGLKRLPTPQPPAALIERTRARAELQMAAEAEHRWNHRVIAFVILFAWTLTLASWPVVRLLSGDLLGWFDPAFGRAWVGFAGFTALAWLGGGIAAAMLAVHQRRERRTA